MLDCVALPLGAMFSPPEKTCTSARLMIFRLPGRSTRTKRPLLPAAGPVAATALISLSTKLPLLDRPGPWFGSRSSGSASSLNAVMPSRFGAG